MSGGWKSNNNERQGGRLTAEVESRLYLRLTTMMGHIVKRGGGNEKQKQKD